MESLWPCGKASERGIRSSKVRFLVRTQNFHLSHPFDKKKKIFLYFFTELFYKNDDDDYNDMIMLITMIMLTRKNDNGDDKDNYRDP